ncbi:hypothetical protein [Nostoc sp. S13]|uniref:hypothetical protein n=1 Tax=Nostoc sp. S13 TaxID=3019266 RepID=UPI002621A5D8|nr:hypothetical protein [Nostoc sp. S13]MDF5735614.1 hypothetical protein [Nostoc sp. S13]
MLKPNRVSIVLATAALIIVPALLAAPANAQTGERDRDWNRDGRTNTGEVRNLGDRGNWNRDGRTNTGEVRNLGDRGNWNRDNQYNSRAVRLRNGDLRLANGRIISAREVVRLRNGYSRLPDGVIIGPQEEFYAPGYVIPAERPSLINIHLF